MMYITFIGGSFLESDGVENRDGTNKGRHHAHVTGRAGLMFLCGVRFILAFVQDDKLIQADPVAGL